jgi:molybdate transport system substrate-binding protein
MAAAAFVCRFHVDADTGVGAGMQIIESPIAAELWTGWLLLQTSLHVHPVNAAVFGYERFGDAIRNTLKAQDDHQPIIKRSYVDPLVAIRTRPYRSVRTANEAAQQDSTMPGSTAEPRATNEIWVLSAAAMGEIIRDIGDAFECISGVKVMAEFSRSPLVLDRIRAGEIYDVAVTTQTRIEELGREHKIIPETGVEVARSLIGVAIRAGSPKPDISSVEAFVCALRNASSIACADPKVGTASGLYLKDLFDRLGLTAELKAKLHLISATGDDPVVVCAAVADGRAEVGIQQIAEIIPVPGVELLGPLPKDIGHVTAFGVGVPMVAPNHRMARKLVAYFNSPEARDVIRKHGMEPA